MQFEITIGIARHENLDIKRSIFSGQALPPMQRLSVINAGLINPSPYRKERNNYDQKILKESIVCTAVGSRIWRLLAGTERRTGLTEADAKNSRTPA